MICYEMLCYDMLWPTISFQATVSIWMIYISCAQCRYYPLHLRVLGLVRTESHWDECIGEMCTIPYVPYMRGWSAEQTEASRRNRERTAQGRFWCSTNQRVHPRSLPSSTHFRGTNERALTCARMRTAPSGEDSAFLRHYSAMRGGRATVFPQGGYCTGKDRCYRH